MVHRDVPEVVSKTAPHCPTLIVPALTQEPASTLIHCHDHVLPALGQPCCGQLHLLLCSRAQLSGDVATSVTGLINGVER